jgi:hypothetical protein
MIEVMGFYAGSNANAQKAIEFVANGVMNTDAATLRKIQKNGKGVV